MWHEDVSGETPRIGHTDMAGQVGIILDATANAYTQDTSGTIRPAIPSRLVETDETMTLTMLEPWTQTVINGKTASIDDDGKLSVETTEHATTADDLPDRLKATQKSITPGQRCHPGIQRRRHARNHTSPTRTNSRGRPMAHHARHQNRARNRHLRQHQDRPVHHAMAVQMPAKRPHIRIRPAIRRPHRNRRTASHSGIWTHHRRNPHLPMARRRSDHPQPVHAVTHPTTNRQTTHMGRPAGLAGHMGMVALTWAQMKLVSRYLSTPLSTESE